MMFFLLIRFGPLRINKYFCIRKMIKMKNIKTYICAVSMLMALSCGDAFAQQKGGADTITKVETKADTAVSVDEAVKGTEIDDALLGDGE